MLSKSVDDAIFIKCDAFDKLCRIDSLSVPHTLRRVTSRRSRLAIINPKVVPKLFHCDALARLFGENFLE